MVEVFCPYCKGRAVRVTGKEVYPHRPDLFQKIYYLCRQCRAYVGCHPNTDTPLGNLASPELRRVRVEAHDVFDIIWKSGVKRRQEAYDWLSDQLGIPRGRCHIGQFDISKCRKVIEVCTAYLRGGREDESQGNHR